MLASRKVSDSRASGAVTKAVKDGVLPPVTTQKCVDCGAIATAYDHYKGYAREHWRDVEPVCARHNAIRSKSRPVAEGDPNDQVAVLLRVPRYLLDALGAEAIREGRSRTQQLNWVLKQRYTGATGMTPDDAEGEKNDGHLIREPREQEIWSAA